MSAHVAAASEYPFFCNGYSAVGASPEDLAALEAASFACREDGKWYREGYGPVRGGWGYAGNNGVGWGPTYRS